MKAVALLALLMIVIGCSPKADDANTAINLPEGTPPAASTTNPNAGAPNAGGVAPMTSNVGGMTPVTGTDSLQGAGGGGVGQAAKSMAKEKAANAGGSMSQMPPEDGQ